MQTDHVETLIIGGGQSGLTMSHMLGQRGRPHLVLERHRIAERWRSERWDGLHFQAPNWNVTLPDFPLPHTDPDAYATRDQIADFIADYAAHIAAPVRCGVDVAALRGEASGFIAETSDGTIRANNVIVATGPYQRPVVPAILPHTPGILQLHAARYRNPGQLPEGAVLVVGGGNSGGQIAEELMRAGRRVFFSISRHRRVPRDYRRRNLHWWLDKLGLYDAPPERRGPDRSPMVLTGAYGGHTVDYRRFAEQGMVLLGRAQAAQADATLGFAPDLHASLAHANAAYAAFLDQADAYVAREGLDLPHDPDARFEPPDPPALAAPPIRRLDLRESGIATVIWATGYALDFGWIDAPVFGASGAPLHHRGITQVPGLYFLGLSYLSRFGSAFLQGVGADAARLADHIAARALAGAGRS